MRDKLGRFMKGFKPENNIGFKKGMIPWNKGKKGIMPIPWNKDKKFPQYSGKNSPNWRGGMKEKKCLICNNSFYAKPSHFDKRKCCSKKCDNKFRRFFFKGNRTSFKKGHPKPQNAYKFPKGENHYHWKGGKYKQSKGYILIYQLNHPFANKQGYIFEHRLVMEKYLGRYLTKNEVVHHHGTKYPMGSFKDKGDNRKENLKLFSNETEHRKFHNKYKFIYNNLP